MDETNQRHSTRGNGPASDDNNHTSDRSTTFTQPDGPAAERPPVVKDVKNKNKQGTKALWATVFKCFSCGKHGHSLPKAGSAPRLTTATPTASATIGNRTNPCAEPRWPPRRVARTGSEWRVPCESHAARLLAPPVGA